MRFNDQRGRLSFSTLLSFFKIRRIRVIRQRNSGLGLSIKGGTEHKLPILISRIFKDQAADLTSKLYVGDAILKGNNPDTRKKIKNLKRTHFRPPVNQRSLLRCTHDEAVSELRKAGDEVFLTVRHYKAATPFLNKGEQCISTFRV